MIIHLALFLNLIKNKVRYKSILLLFFYSITSCNNNIEENEIPLIIEENYTMKTNKCGNQGLTIVNNEMWHFHNSNESHHDYAYIMRFNMDSFKEIPAKQHNLGHAANADYSAENNAMLIANGSSNTNVLPRLDILLNPSNTGLKINYGDRNIISIPFFTDKKQIGGSGLIACWGETKDEIYLLTGQNSPRTIFKVLLGMGTIDYSDKSSKKDDILAWGTFISGKTEKEFNGTAKILNKYIGTETGVYQGCCFRDGYIWLCVGTKKPEILKIKCNTDGTFNIKYKIQLLVRDEKGNVLDCEPEGICMDEKYMYVGLTKGRYGIAAIPLNNR